VSQPLQLPQLALLERIVATIKTDPRVHAAFLRGSFYRGRPDAYSDLDIFVVTEEVSAEVLHEIGRDVLASTGEVVWISLINATPPQLRALFPGPVRVDLTMVTPQILPAYNGWRVLFDDQDVLQRRGRPAIIFEPLQPEHVVAICDEFWWQLFSSVSQLKRGRLWMAIDLLDTCRSDLAQMMRWRRDRDRPSERFNDLELHLTAEDQQALAQTLAGYDLRGIAEALLCAADAFDPAGRDVAARVGAEYPAGLAHITKEFFIREFWALIAPGPAMSA
jgi:streptomycin adenylyltransferase